MLQPLRHVTVDVSTSTGYAFIRVAGFVQPLKLTMAEVDVLVSIDRLLEAEASELEGKSIGGHAGVEVKRAKRKAAGV